MKKSIGIFYTLLICLNYSCSKDNADQKNINESPGMVTLIFPENNTECKEGTIISDTQSEVAFRWNPSKNADSYILEINNLDLNTPISQGDIQSGVCWNTPVYCRAGKFDSLNIFNGIT